MGDSFETELGQVRQRQSGAAPVEQSGKTSLANDGDDFEVQHFGRHQPFASEPGAVKGPKTPMHGRLQENRRDGGASEVRGGAVDPEEPCIRLAKFLPI